MCPSKRCRFLEAAKAIIDERRCLEWGYVPSRDLMGYYWKGQWVGGDTVDDAIHFIADQIDASQSPKSMPSCCREQALVGVIENMVLQSCLRTDGLIDSMAITAYAEAMDILADYGKIEITSSCGRRVIARRREGGQQ